MATGLGPENQQSLMRGLAKSTAKAVTQIIDDQSRVLGAAAAFFDTQSANAEVVESAVSGERIVLRLRMLPNKSQRCLHL